MALRSRLRWPAATLPAMLAALGATWACSSSDSTSAQPASTSGDAGSQADPDAPSSGDAPSSTTDGGSSSDGGSNGSSKPNCKYQAHKTGMSTLQQAGGLSFTVYAPTTYDPNVGHTVVIIMHGQDSNGVAELTTLWKPIADEPGKALVLVAPKGSRPATNADPNGANWATADLNDVQDIITLVDDCYNVLTKKHILWGFSEGAFYGYLLGIGAATQFSGLAMGGANASFARQNGYPPSSATWKIPVSHVHGTQDPNPISVTYQDRTDFQNAGHVFTLHEHSGGHTISPAQVHLQYDDLSASTSP